MRRALFPTAALLLAPIAASAQTASPPPPVGAALVAPGWRVADLDRSTKFYATALGLKPCTTLQHGTLTEVILCTDARPPRPLVILLHEAGAGAAQPGASGGLDKLVIRVPDLNGVTARLKAAGYGVGDIRPAAARAPAVLWIKDPDDHGLELLGAPAP